jgi:hypothetical protein
MGEVGYAQLERVRRYIDDERHVYTGPRHKRRQQAVADLVEVSDVVRALRAENEHLREALEKGLEKVNALAAVYLGHVDDDDGKSIERVIDWGDVAREALQAHPAEPGDGE